MSVSYPVASQMPAPGGIPYGAVVQPPQVKPVQQMQPPVHQTAPRPYPQMSPATAPDQHPQGLATQSNQPPGGMQGQYPYQNNNYYYPPQSATVRQPYVYVPPPQQPGVNGPMQPQPASAGSHVYMPQSSQVTVSGGSPMYMPQTSQGRASVESQVYVPQTSQVRAAAEPQVYMAQPSQVTVNGGPQAYMPQIQQATATAGSQVYRPQISHFRVIAGSHFYMPQTTHVRASAGSQVYMPQTPQPTATTGTQANMPQPFQPTVNGGSQVYMPQTLKTALSGGSHVYMPQPSQETVTVGSQMYMTQTSQATGSMQAQSSMLQTSQSPINRQSQTQSQPQVELGGPQFTNQNQTGVYPRLQNSEVPNQDTQQMPMQLYPPTVRQQTNVQAAQMTPPHPPNQPQGGPPHSSPYISYPPQGNVVASQPLPMITQPSNTKQQASLYTQPQLSNHTPYSQQYQSPTMLQTVATCTSYQPTLLPGQQPQVVYTPAQALQQPQVDYSQQQIPAHTPQHLPHAATTQGMGIAPGHFQATGNWPHPQVAVNGRLDGATLNRGNQQLGISQIRTIDTLLCQAYELEARILSFSGRRGKTFFYT